MAETNCRYFTGYKPCGYNEVCDFQCDFRSIPTCRLLIVHLGAMGAVLRATSILPAIKRKYPGSHITWVTDKICQPLLQHNPYIDRILTSEFSDTLTLSSLKFDVAFCVDKSLKATGLLKQTQYESLFGFQVDSSTGAIIPANEEARELWELGLSNEKKFFVNQKPETQLLVEALDLGPFQRDEYTLQLSDTERDLSLQRRRLWVDSLSPKPTLLGINTGCASTIPYKRLSVDGHIELINRIQSRHSQIQLVLLGGPEDTERNQQIQRKTQGVLLSPTQNGVRDGLASVAACDLVVTGDSLGMHMAIALKKYVVAWFGPTCAHEIDLFDRGVKVLTPVSCSPCWKRVCHQSPMCYDQVKMSDFLRAIENYFTNDQEEDRLTEVRLETDL